MIFLDRWAIRTIVAFAPSVADCRWFGKVAGRWNRGGTGARVIEKILLGNIYGYQKYFAYYLLISF
jgi:hypothetical protein